MTRTVLSNALRTLLLLAVITPTLGFRGCPPESNSGEPVSPERQAEIRVERGAAAILFTERRIEGGIPAARAFREAGKFSVDFNLVMARVALGVAIADGKMIDVALSDDPRAASILGLVSAALDGAQELENSQVVQFKGDTAKLVFNLGVIEGKNQLAALRDDLQSAPDGYRLPVTPKARTDLGRAREVNGRNKTALAEAVRRLEELKRKEGAGKMIQEQNGKKAARGIPARQGIARTLIQTPREQVGSANEAHKRMYAYAESGQYAAGYSFENDLRAVGAALDIANVTTGATRGARGA